MDFVTTHIKDLRQRSRVCKLPSLKFKLLRFKLPNLDPRPPRLLSKKRSPQRSIAI